MKYTEEDYKIGQILYEKMKTLPIGTEMSVSELGMMALGVAFGDTVKVSADGSDETQALESIVKYLSNN